MTSGSARHDPRAPRRQAVSLERLAGQLEHPQGRRPRPTGPSASSSGSWQPDACSSATRQRSSAREAFTQPADIQRPLGVARFGRVSAANARSPAASTLPPFAPGGFHQRPPARQRPSGRRRSSTSSTASWARGSPARPDPGEHDVAPEGCRSASTAGSEERRTRTDRLAVPRDAERAGVRGRAPPVRGCRLLRSVVSGGDPALVQTPHRRRATR